MKKKEKNTEQAILAAAEHEFLERGFAGAKTVAIARRAGITHAMLHYYFRTKENLFNIVLQRKILILAESVLEPFDRDLPFFAKLELVISSHFDFIMANPKLMEFIYNEVLSNEERKNALREIMFPRLGQVIAGFTKGIEGEVAKGTIRSVKPIELFLNMVSINVVTFLAQPIIEIIQEHSNADGLRFTFDERKKHNVEFIINALRV